MHTIRKTLAGVFLAGSAVSASPAVAQLAGENALEESDDAFGTHVGLESTGIYTESDTRGFNPLDAGNVRIDGIYFDQVSFLTNKLRQTTAIRVGFGATETPFVAPTGVVDHQLKAFPEETGASLSYTRFYYGGIFLEGEFRGPIERDKIAVIGGFGYSEFGQADGAQSHSWGVTLRPTIRLGRFEFSPFYGGGDFSRVDAKPLAVVTEGYLPKVPPSGKYLGQKWVRGAKKHGNVGATLKGAISDHLYFRGGIFDSIGDKSKNFSEIYRIEDASGLSSHLVFADPPHDVNSKSGEGLFVLHFRNDRVRHRIFAGFRARDRFTETGGADFFDLGSTIHGQIDHVPKPQFEFEAINKGRVRQSSWMLAYVGFLKDVGQINIGIQKANYRASLIEGATGAVDRSRADPWLYNAALLLKITPSLSAYVATQRGLEDSGIAPGNASNRDQQLPATKSTQYEGGLRWDFGKGQLVLAAFEITKPYFSFDENREFIALADQRHRGLEVSLASHFTERFDMLLGAVLMDPSVTGPGAEAGLVGERPAGVPKAYGRVDANYRTDLPGDLTLTGSLEYQGSRPATGAPVEHLGNKQLMLPSFVSFDLGTRQVFPINNTNVAIRLLLRNVLDEKGWHVAAPDVLLPKHRRSLLAVVSVDF